MKLFIKNLEFALYCASIIIGAGVLTLPLSASQMGFVPLIVLIVIEGLGLLLIYRRLAETLFSNVTSVVREKELALSFDPAAARPDTFKIFRIEASRGAALLDSVIRRTGLGRAGLGTLLVGMILYVYFADVGYIILGNRSLNGLVTQTRGFGSDMLPIFFVVGGLLILTSLFLPRFWSKPSALRGALQKSAMMGGCWGIGLALLDLNTKIAGSTQGNSFLGSVLFLVAIIASMFSGKTVQSDEDESEGLNAQHRVNMVVMVVELGLLVFASVLALWIFGHAGIIQPFFAFAPDWLASLDLVTALQVGGVVLFAYVGTGMFNLCIYPQLFARNQGAKKGPRFTQVVTLGTLLPMAVYIWWTVTSGFLLSPADLYQTDAANEGTHIAIAQKAAVINPELYWTISLSGYLFALMAVTSACVGFTESLADRMALVFQRSKVLRSPTVWKIIILLAAALMAIGKDLFAANIAITSILAIAGYAGGGLLVVILPLFFPYPLERRSRIRYAEVLLVALLAFLIVGAIISWPTEGSTVVSQVVTYMKWAVALAVAGMTLWLLVSEPPDLPSGATAALLPPSGGTSLQDQLAQATRVQSPSLMGVPRPSAGAREQDNPTMQH